MLDKTDRFSVYYACVPLWKQKIYKLSKEQTHFDPEDLKEMREKQYFVLYYLILSNLSSLKKTTQLKIWFLDKIFSDLTKQQKLKTHYIVSLDTKSTVVLDL